MIKDNQKIFNRLHLLMDAVLVSASYAAAYYLKFFIFSPIQETGAGVLPAGDYFWMLPFIVPGYLLIYHFCHIYTPRRASRDRTEIFSILQANLIGIGLWIVALYLVLKEINFSRSMMAIFFVLNVALTASSRVFLRNFLRNLRRKGYNLKHILLVGYSRAAEAYIDRILENPQWGYVVRGILDDYVPAGAKYKGVEVLGGIDRMAAMLPVEDLDEIAITLALSDYSRLEELVSQCEKSGIHTKFIPDYHSVVSSNPSMEDMLGLPVINIRNVPLANAANAMLKRLVDIAAALVGLILASPVMLLAAVLVAATSRGPVFFAQERVGRGGRAFRMYKFRSMELQDPGEERKAWTVKNDPRVTRVGRILRRSSIDELPQLWNILKGDMSLIGPRPERPHYVDKFREEIPRYMIKHQVRPGLTGWAQVHGLRGDTSIKKRIEYDLYYIENWTLFLDIKIVIMTLFLGFVNKNAY